MQVNERTLGPASALRPVGVVQGFYGWTALTG